MYISNINLHINWLLYLRKKIDIHKYSSCKKYRFRINQMNIENTSYTYTEMQFCLFIKS